MPEPGSKPHGDVMNPDDVTTPLPSTGTDADSSNDYSYDLAHEAPEAVRAPAGGRADPARSHPQGQTVDPGGDYSYDLAHEVEQPQTPPVSPA